jgi:transcriptional regulator with PAS, ATPase and Fis domain
MPSHAWVQEFPSAITVCDRQGIILEMNDRACLAFKEDGGAALIGSNVLDCHPQPAREKLVKLLESGQRNIYTIEKKGKKKMICQSPWYVQGEYAGFLELSIELPEDIPHYIRR